MADKKSARKPSKPGKTLGATKSPALSEDKLDKVTGGTTGGAAPHGPSGPGG